MCPDLISLNLIRFQSIGTEMTNFLKSTAAVLILLATGMPGHAQFYTGARFDSTFTEYFRRNSGGWTAGDATISVPLSDQRVIWLFGDSYIVDVDTTDNTLPCLFQIRNCMVVQDSADLNSMVTHIDSTQTGIFRTPFKLPESSELELLWPDHGFEYRDSVFIFFSHLDNDTWELIDLYVARLTMPSLELADMKLLPDKAGYNFGRCILTDSAAGYRYIYGNKVNWIVWEPFVARCPLDGLFGEWEYWTASGWSDDIDALWKISELPVSPSFSVVRIDNRYYLITQENGYLTCGMGREIYAYESDYPTGPFTNKRLLYTEESMLNERYLLTYNAFSHPFFTTDDELLISYNVNDWVDTLDPYVCPSQCKNVWTDRIDADSYRPKFIRVPFGLITGQLEPDPSFNGDQPFLIYPNPARNLVEVTLQNCAQPLTVQLYNTNGQLTESKWISGNNPDEKLILDVSGLPSGIYFVNITSLNFQIGKKLLVQ